MQYYNHAARRPVGYPAGLTDSPVSAVTKTADNGNDFQNPSALPLLTGQSLGMAYVPFQRFEDLLEPEKALECGTLFRALYKPFYGQKRRQNV